MALSYYSNWGTFQQLNLENVNGFPETEQLAAEHELLLGLMNNVGFAFPEACNNNIDHLFDPIQEEENFFFYPSAESYLSAGDNYILLSDTNNIPSEPIFDPFDYVPKRHKPCDNYASNYQFKPPLFFPDTNPSCLTQQDYYLPAAELSGAAPLPDFPLGPPVYNGGNCDQSVKKLAANGGSLSSQSIAARQRRRKITEKTQELGKLIPGGQKMNTAEMFRAAYKYIKYMQAQVGILEFMASDHYQEKSIENGERVVSEEMQGLLESPVVQEKLYSAEKCFVPMDFIHGLVDGDHEIFQFKPQLLKDVRQLFPIKEN